MASANGNQLANTPLREQQSRSAFAFRGYNIFNLGRTPELWAIEAYRPILQRWLDLGSSVCQSVLGRSSQGQPVDLVARVLDKQDPNIDHYAEAIALVMAIEFAQIDLLHEHHAIDYHQAPLAYGYSLGELSAVAANGIISHADAMRIPLELAHDSAMLSDNVVMGILFSRAEAIAERNVVRLCDQITSECDGVIGVSAVLSPNTYLLLGQGNTIDRFKSQMPNVFSRSVHLKRDSHRWPPLHTPIVRQQHIPDRASILMQNMLQNESCELPQIFSLATGAADYQTQPTREILRRWVDHPQRLWDAVLYTLSLDIQTVIHVGPAPNVIPATFHRLSDNVRQQLQQLSFSGLGKRAISRLASRPWLANLLPNSASLLRAPTLRHVILEDWLIEHAPK